MTPFQPGQKGQSREVFSGVCRFTRKPGKKVEVGVKRDTPAHEAHRHAQDDLSRVSLGTGTGATARAIGNRLEQEARKPETQNCGPGAIPTGVTYTP